MTDAVMIVTTFANRVDAEQMADRLVEAKLAACVQVSGPVRSTYRWQDALQTEEEWLCTIKTTRAAVARVEHAVHRWHPYDEPEILALPVLGGSPGYLHWLAAQVQVDSEPLEDREP